MKKVKRPRRNNNYNKKTENTQQFTVELESYQYFPTTIYSADLSEFLDIATKVSDEYIKYESCDLNELYPVRMSGNLSEDPRLEEFSTVILNLGWDILNEQGYDMDKFRVVFSSMWTQQHYKYSLMEQHIHNGDQLVGFYFLKTPENSSRPVFYDPRPAKVITSLPEKQMQEVTFATNIVNFDPTPGRMFITNTFVPHSFSKNGSNDPVEFIHFNMYVVPYTQETRDVEIV